MKSFRVNREESVMGISCIFSDSEEVTNISCRNTFSDVFLAIIYTLQMSVVPVIFELQISKGAVS